MSNIDSKINTVNNDNVNEIKNNSIEVTSNMNDSTFNLQNFAKVDENAGTNLEDVFAALKTSDNFSFNMQLFAGSYSVENGVAVVNGGNTESLKAAIESNYDTIKITSEVALGSTLDFRGKTVIFDNSSNPGSAAFNVAAAATLTNINLVLNPTAGTEAIFTGDAALTLGSGFKCNYDSIPDGCAKEFILVNTSSDVTIDGADISTVAGGSVVWNKKGSFTIKSGRILQVESGNGSYSPTVVTGGDKENDKVNVEGGVIQRVTCSDTTVSHERQALYVWSASEVNVTAGEISVTGQGSGWAALSASKKST